MEPTLLLPELVRDSHLDTRMTPGYCIHLFRETPTVTRKEVWKRTKRIGAGGFGTVWLETCVDGHETGKDTQRAVKVLQLPSEAPVQDAIAQCSRELEALAKFSQRKYSRCFVKSYGWYEYASSISICLEYLPLGDLRAYIAKRGNQRLPEPEAKQITSQILDGLVFMHAEGFTHRDLKPANVLIKSLGPDDWWVKLSDFGLSKRAEVTQSATGLQGTPGFMAPELLGFHADDQSSRTKMWRPADLWCLGEIAFQLVTGRATFLTPGALLKYTLGKSEFPTSELQKVMASPASVDFITTVMLVDYTRRPTAEDASSHQWLRELKSASPVLLSHVELDSRDSQEVPEDSAVFNHTALSIEYRDWSTFASTPVTSPQDLTGVNPFRRSLRSPANAVASPQDLTGSNPFRRSLRDPANAATSPQDFTGVNPFLRSLRDPENAAKNPPDTIRPLQDILNQEESPIVIAQRASGKAQQPLTRDPDDATLCNSSLPSASQPLTSPRPLEKREQNPEVEWTAATQRGLAWGTKWYSDSEYIYRTISSNSGDELNVPQQLSTEVVTKVTIDELTGSSAETLAAVLQVAVLKGTQKGSHQLIFSQDSKALVTTSVDEHVGLWSIEDKVLIRVIKSAGKYATFSPDSRQIATVTQSGAAYIIDTSLSRLDQGSRMELRGPAEEIRCVAFSPTGHQLIAGTSKGTLIVWDPVTTKTPKKIKAHSSAVLWVAHQPIPGSDGEHYIVGAEADGWVSVWKYEFRWPFPDRWASCTNDHGKGKNKTRLHVGGSISAAAASKSFARLAVAAVDGSIKIWHNERGKEWIEGLACESVSKRHGERIDVLDFSPDSKLLASASSNSVRIWQVRGGLPVAVIQVTDFGIPQAVAFSPDSTSLASISSGGVVRLWNTEKLQCLSDVQDHLDRASFIAASPDQRHMVSVIRELRPDGLDELDDLKSDALNREYRDLLREQRLPVDTDIATLMVWDVAQARPLTLMSGHKAEVLSISFSKDSKYVGSISADHVLRIWDVGTGKCLDKITRRTNRHDIVPCASLSAGLRYCAAVFRCHVEQEHMRYKFDYNYRVPSGFAISLCDIRPEEPPSWDPHPCKALIGTEMEDDILALAFSPDATKLAAIDQKDNVTVWDTASGAMIARLSDPTQVAPGSRNPIQSDSKSTRNFAKYRAHMCDVGNPALHFISETEIAAFSGLSVVRFWHLVGRGKLLRRFGNSFISSKYSKAGLTSLYDGALSYCSYSTPLAVSPDGTRCITFKSRQELALWDVGTAELVVVLARDTPKDRDGVRHVSFSPDSRWLVTASGEALWVRDAATGKIFTVIKTGGAWPLRMVTFWPDSQYLVSGCYKGMLQFWDIQSGAMVKEYEGHTGRRSVVI